MFLRKNSYEIKEEDELLHQATNEEKWRESYYFNWVDSENKISGFSTIGILPNQNKKEFVFVLFSDKDSYFYYKEPMLEKNVNDIDITLQDKRLSYKMIIPFKEWQITYKDKKIDFNLKFTTRFKTFSFGTSSSASWQQHYEASGIVDGKIKFENDANIKVIKGYGQRDKSWGFRDWHQFNKWYAGHFQFKNWAAAFRKDFRKNQMDLSGYVINENLISRISYLEIETSNDNDRFKSPLTSIYNITSEDKKEYKIKAERIATNSYARFARDFQDGYTELYEQMVIVKDLKTNEIGTGMSEELRTIKNFNE